MRASGTKASTAQGRSELDSLEWTADPNRTFSQVRKGL
jgi:hypothetical protein